MDRGLGARPALDSSGLDSKVTLNQLKGCREALRTFPFDASSTTPLICGVAHVLRDDPESLQ